MNKKEVQRIERTVAKWQTAMNLGHITISNYFADEETDSVAEVVTAWEYLQAGIIWYAPNVVQLNQDELDEAVFHELGHIMVGPMSDFLPEAHSKLEEFVVQSIAKALMGVKNGIPNKR